MFVVAFFHRCWVGADLDALQCEAEFFSLSDLVRAVEKARRDEEDEERKTKEEDAAAGRRAEPPRVEYDTVELYKLKDKLKYGWRFVESILKPVNNATLGPQAFVSNECLSLVVTALWCRVTNSINLRCIASFQRKKREDEELDEEGTRSKRRALGGGKWG